MTEGGKKVTFRGEEKLIQVVYGQVRPYMGEGERGGMSWEEGKGRVGAGGTPRERWREGERGRGGWEEGA